jgi:alpha-mannosidase
VLGPAGAAPEPAIRVEGDVVVSALKPAEDGRGVVLRAFNPGPDEVLMRIVGDVTITPVRLDETELTEEEPGRPLQAGEIRSLRLVRR